MPRVLFVFFSLCILTSACSPGISAQLSVPAVVSRDIEFAKPDDYSLKLDVFRPVSSELPTPVVIFVHGGGWKNGSKKSGEKNAGWLVDEGFAVVSIDYRLTDVAQWPAQIDDCYEAVRWVRRNADQFNFDPNHIAAWGTSAGGHLVALMGTRRYFGKEGVSSRVQAVCDWFGPSDLLTMPPNTVGNGRTEEDVAKSNGAKLLGKTVKDAVDLANDASGLHHVSSDDCAFLIMHGSEDPGVPIVQSEKLHAKLKSAGVESTLHVVNGAGHGGKLFHTQQSRAVVRAFFTKHLMNNWHQGSGPEANYISTDLAPATWSVTRDQNIKWKVSLPETGQNTVCIWGNRLFFSTMEEVTADTELGRNIVAWCCDARTGETLWQKSILGAYPLRLSGCFSDSSSPSAVTDGKHVCFFNASGRINCFDMNGSEIWSREMMPVGRTQPFLHNGNVVFIRQRYMPDKHGHFSHEHKNAPPEQWTNLQALNLRTGEPAWASTCGVNMGCIPLLQKLGDGRDVILVGRGGGHSPPERPEGVSMISADDGSTIWTLPLPGFMSTQTYPVHGQYALVFHGDQHLWVDVTSGKIAKQISITNAVGVRAYRDGRYEDRQETLPSRGKRCIIQQSNLLVGDYHYFRSYTHPYIGRIHAETGVLEYLQVPIQVSRDAHGLKEVRLWDVSQLTNPIPTDKKSRPFGAGTKVSYVAWELNDVKNSRGFRVMGDSRSQGNGWGHHASAIPSASGGRLHMPIMSGMVYVLDAGAPKLTEAALMSISDLGPLNRTWTRSSLSFAGDRIYARTIKELICISE